MTPDRGAKFGPLRRGLAVALAWIGMAVPPAAGAATEVHLYVSSTTQAYFPGAGGNYDAVVKPWRQLLAGASIPARELARPEELASLPGGVLILPSAVALSELERRALLDFVRRGGNLLASWATGSRDVAGRWLGFDFIRELMGAVVTGELAKEAKNRFLIPYGQSPLNRTVPAGRRIWLGQTAEKPLLLRGGAESAAYLDWARSAMKTGDHHSAIVFDEVGASRRVMFGFAETSWDFQPDDVRALAIGALQWLLRSPHARIGAWPGGYQAAQLIEMDTEEGFGNAVHFAELMEGMNAAGTFYSLTSEARKNRALLRKLVEKHEVGFHGEVHVGFQGPAREKQQARLDRMMSDMHDILGTANRWPRGAGRGFRAPTEAYDETTESLLVALGFLHHVADPNRSPDRLPMFAGPIAPDGSGALVVLPRGQADDLNYIHLKLTGEQAGAALIAEYELNLRMGGLGIVSVHSQNFADPDRLLDKPLHTSLMTKAVEDLARHVGSRHEPVWIAPGGQISQWWRDRHRARLSTRITGAGLECEIAVTGTEPVRLLTILIDHPHAKGVPKVRVTGSASPGFELRRIDQYSSALVIAALPTGTSRYLVTFP